MRRGYLGWIAAGITAAGCGFRSSAAQPDGAVPDGGVADTRSFDASGLRLGQLVDMAVDARGALTPTAYTYGGLVAHGLQGASLWRPDDTRWDNLAGVQATGAGLWTGEEIENGVRTDYLGVVTDTTMTLWLEGEVWLDGGAAETFGVGEDAIGFVELAPPGSTSYTRIASNATGSIPAQLVASGPGWYPVRVGFSNDDGTFEFAFTHDGGTGSQHPWTRDRLRARTSELSGMLRTVFGRQLLAGGLALGGGVVASPVPHFEQSELLRPDLTAPPQGAPPEDDDWSARYVGQVYVTRSGTYTLRIASDDGSRGRLGSGRGEAHWRRDDGVGPVDAMTSVSAVLAAGWNDLAVDYNQVSGGSRVRVQIQGPDYAAPVEIPRDRLRPVEPGDDRLALGVDDHTYPVPENGGAGNPATATLSVTGYTGATGAEIVAAIDVTCEIDAEHWDQLKVDLETPGSPGTRLTIRNQDRAPGDSDRIVQLAITQATPGLGALLGGPANGDWKLHVYDEPGGASNTPELRSARLTLHTMGGPDKIARTASWVSAPIDAATPVFAIDGITWNERVPAGASVQVRLGSCHEADCSDIRWSDAVIAGAPFAVAPARYLQLRVDMTSNGALEPELQGLRVMFRREG